jgi:AbrB family looped-hinge helix DNA binding protein
MQSYRWNERRMSRTRLSSKGQVVIPQAVRDAKAWGPGTELDIVEVADGILVRPAAAAADPHALDGLIGLLVGHARQPVPTEADVSAAIDGLMRERFAPKARSAGRSRKRPRA